MTRDNSTHPPSEGDDAGEGLVSGAKARRPRLRRLLFSPRTGATFALGMIAVLAAAGVLGANAFGLRSALTASSLPSGFQSASMATYGSITPTQTTCSQFASGNAGTLSNIQYSVKRGKISQVDPGVFYYWVAVTVPKAGTYTYTIQQTTTPTYPYYFALAKGSAVYDSSCNVVKNATITKTSSGGANTVTFTVTQGGTYYIGLKYNTGSLVGKPAPSSGTVSYTFTTNGGEPATVQLVPKH